MHFNALKCSEKPVARMALPQMHEVRLVICLPNSAIAEKGCELIVEVDSRYVDVIRYQMRLHVMDEFVDGRITVVRVLCMIQQMNRVDVEAAKRSDVRNGA